VSQDGKLALAAAAPSVRALAAELLGPVGEAQIREAAAALRAMRDGAGALLQSGMVETGVTPVEVSAAG
jgi:hypothetical protein